MSKNIVICCDGTNNQFGSNNTNVVRLVEVMNRNPKEQIIYYDPGVGTLPEPGFVTKVGKKFSEIMGLAFGLGLTRKISEAYSFLMDHYEAGDSIYLFGFSRGSYTVRALAGVIFQFGLLPAGSYNLLPYLLRLSKAIKRVDESDSAAGKKYWELTRGFRATFARTSPGTASRVEYVRVHFLGVWDTVSSVGWVWDPTHFPYTAYNPCIEIFRHAVAIDERRWFFRQNLWDKPKTPPTQNVREYWFPGVHCDIGGGYPEESSGLWRTAFIWMLLEAKKAGLKIDTQKVREVLHKTRIRLPAWANEKHESLTWYWWPAEFFPKIPKWRGAEFRWPSLGLFRCRTIRDGELLHRSALRRIRLSETRYSPGNISPAFQQSVRELGKVPEALPYRTQCGGS
jgi:uncharacterized protein (DUF2235 family)